MTVFENGQSNISNDESFEQPRRSLSILEKQFDEIRQSCQNWSSTIWTKWTSGSTCQLSTKQNCVVRLMDDDNLFDEHMLDARSARRKLSRSWTVRDNALYTKQPVL